MIDAARIVFDPAAPWSTIALLAALCAAFLVAYVVRGGQAPVSRGLAILLFLAALAQPMFVRERRESAPDIAAVVVDQSESMALAGRKDAARAAGEALAKRLAALGLEVRTTEASGGPDGTALLGPLRDLLRDAPRDRLAGAFLVTDGQVSDVPRDLAALRPFAPLHAMIVGDPDRGHRRLVLLSAPSYGIVGAPARIEARVDDKTAGLSVPVTVSIDGVLAARVTAISGKPFTVDVATPKRGANMVVVEAAAGPSEISLVNNRAAFNLMGVRDRLRVLLVTGEPHAGARVWRNILKSDPSVDLVHFTILRPPDKENLTPQEELALITFPTRELFIEKLGGFDLIIFDRYRRRGTIMSPEYFENIAKRVEAGGALLIVAGPADAEHDGLAETPLSRILSSAPTGQLYEKPYRPALTELGRRHPVTRSLPEAQNWGRWQRQIGARVEGGEVVLSGADGPLLVLNRAGAGRVAQLWSDQAWLWSRGYDGGGPQSELLRRLAHWLMQEPELEDERLTLTYGAQGLVAERTTLGGPPPPAEILDPRGGKKLLPLTQIGPGDYRGVTDAAAQGLYQARQSGLSAFAAVGPLNPQEVLNLEATSALLKPAAQATGGGVFMLGESGARLPELRRVGMGEAHGAGWAGVRRRNAYTVRNSISEPLLPGWAWGFGAAALMLFSWRREGR